MSEQSEELKRAQWSIQHGIEFPYDDRRPQSLPNAIALGVMADLTDRRGIKNGFENIDVETRQNIVASIANIVSVGMESQFENMTNPAETSDIRQNEQDEYFRLADNWVAKSQENNLRLGETCHAVARDAYHLAMQVTPSVRATRFPEAAQNVAEYDKRYDERYAEHIKSGLIRSAADLFD